MSAQVQKSANHKKAVNSHPYKFADDWQIICGIFNVSQIYFADYFHKLRIRRKLAVIRKCLWMRNNQTFSILGNFRSGQVGKGVG